MKRDETDFRPSTPYVTSITGGHLPTHRPTSTRRLITLVCALMITACDVPTQSPVDLISSDLSGLDVDGDGDDADVDDDDDDGDVFPGAVERCDGKDNDWDPSTREAGRAARVKDGIMTDASELFASGTAPIPKEIEVADEILYGCAGIFHVNLRVSGSTTIRGLSTTADTVLSGGSLAPVVHIKSGFDVIIDEVTLTLGRGTATDFNDIDMGGGVLCAGDASLYLSDALLVNNVASHGAGVAALDGCDATIERTEIARNTATIGGGLYFWGAGYRELASVVVADNTARAGSGLFVDGGGQAWRLHLPQRLDPTVPPQTPPPRACAFGSAATRSLYRSWSSKPSCRSIGRVESSVGSASPAHSGWWSDALARANYALGLTCTAWSSVNKAAAITAPSSLQIAQTSQREGCRASSPESPLTNGEAQRNSPL